jgi:hypothetical protein
MSNLESALGTKTTTINIGGKLIELMPITIGNMGEITNYCRSMAIKAFYATAKEAGLSNDIISRELRELNKTANLEDVANTPDGLAYIVYLRAKHAGITLNDVQALPIEEIMAQAEMILDSGTTVESDDKKK